MLKLFEIGETIHKQSGWLGRALVEQADQALCDFNADNHATAVSKVAACLEGTVKKLLDDWQVPYARETFGQLIGKLREMPRVPKSLVERLSDANAIRNRSSVHDQDPDDIQRVNEGDSLVMLHSLRLLVSWGGTQISRQPATPADLPVFLSVGTEHRLDQLQFLQRLRRELRDQAVDLKHLIEPEYADQRPFDQIRELMLTCKGALIVGLERSHAYTVFEREQSKKQEFYPDQYIPTAWNQIEGAMASALQLPVLVLTDDRLHSEGIFEAKNHRHRRETFNLAEEARELSPALRELLASWVKYVRRVAPQYPVSG